MREEWALQTPGGDYLARAQSLRGRQFETTPDRNLAATFGTREAARRFASKLEGYAVVNLAAPVGLLGSRSVY